MSWVFRAAAVLAVFSFCGACARAPNLALRHGGQNAHAYAESRDLAQVEAAAIEAAKAHPNAQPRVRPEYPEQAPPPLPPGQSLPPPIYETRRSTPPLDSTTTVSLTTERLVYPTPRYQYQYGLSYGYPYTYPYRYSAGWGPYGYAGWSYGYPYSAGFRLGYGGGLGWNRPWWGHHSHRRHLHLGTFAWRGFGGSRHLSLGRASHSAYSRSIRVRR